MNKLTRAEKINEIEIGAIYQHFITGNFYIGAYRNSKNEMKKFLVCVTDQAGTVISKIPRSFWDNLVYKGRLNKNTQMQYF